MPATLPIDDVLRHVAPTRAAGETLGPSRGGRDVVGYRFGRGSLRVSLIGGCHADEPVGPAMLDRLAAFLERLDAGHSLLAGASWWIVPHANPDGEAANDGWTREVLPLGEGRTGYALAPYLDGAVREAPGDDVEFGFPRGAGDAVARPENRAIAEFLRRGAPFALHGSFHGMAFAAGPWFLMEASWAERTSEMRERLRRRVAELGYRLHDVDRKGEKGFHRIDEGFTTRPDSRAMAAYFEGAGDPATARLFRPSSMEFVRSLGGDPLTLVSEMPLFLLPARHYHEGDVVRPPVLDRLRRDVGPEDLADAARAIGLEAMPIEDQIRLQLAFLAEGLAAVISSPPGSGSPAGPSPSAGTPSRRG
jgi:hypothetical protein